MKMMTVLIISPQDNQESSKYISMCIYLCLHSSMCLYMYVYIVKYMSYNNNTTVICNSSVIVT